jgi:hypothetical protein
MSQTAFQLSMAGPSWPALPLQEWQETRDTLQLYTQVVGKVRMALSPELNHWWHVTLQVNSRGLGTSAIPYGGGIFEIDFDFVKHQLDIHTSEGERKLLPLGPQPVAIFYERVMTALRSLGIEAQINTRPQELSEAVPFEQDFAHASYDREYVYRFWRILISSARVMQEFRARFYGKASPVHFFWGSFDLACTRFSGRSAPPRHGVITGPAYSHEAISAGFWPGGGAVDGPAYYAYAAPPPAGLDAARVEPEQARWDPALGEFILMYDDVRHSEAPERALMSFLESTYHQAAQLAGWDPALERSPAALHA